MGGRELRPAAHLLFLLAQEKKAKECAPLAATPQLSLRGDLCRGMGLSLIHISEPTRPY